MQTKLNHEADVCLIACALRVICNTTVTDEAMQTSLLPILTEVAPLLKASPTAWLTHNILTATTKYTTVVQYIHAHTLLPPGPLSAALLGVVPIWGSVCSFDIAWQRVGIYSSANSTTGCALQAGGRLALDGSVTPAALCAWLRSLAAFIATPVVRPYCAHTHHYPCAMPTWWRLIETLAQRVPLHWLSAAVTPLLDACKPQRRALLRAPRATAASSRCPLHRATRGQRPQVSPGTLAC
jgi:hypothetical protein